ncbi:ectonucleoside triphosphate diphosphohydrolase 5/6 [Pancytospora philotis]|nr:ectonucleoside triphosphate diphosphohydrolase 5/6 [Pancytospora philotis]
MLGIVRAALINLAALLAAVLGTINASCKLTGASASRLLAVWVFAAAAWCRTVGIFDAGSTGTRLTVYTLANGRVVNTATDREAGGLHLMPPDEAASAVDRLLQKSGVSTKVPLWFYGTAGMRSLDAEAQSAQLSAIRGAMGGYNIKEAKVLQGYEEGLYTLKAFEHLSPNRPYFILVDMGGMSTQVVVKDGSRVNIESYDLGITKSNCSPEGNADKHLVLQLSGACGGHPSASAAQSQQFFVTLKPACAVQPRYNNNSCFARQFEMYELKPIKRPAHPPTIHLFSFFHDLYGGQNRKLTRADLERLYRGECSAAYKPRCNKLLYAQSVLDKMGLGNSDVFTIEGQINGQDVTWALGRALDLDRTNAL